MKCGMGVRVGNCTGMKGRWGKATVASLFLTDPLETICAEGID